MVRHRLVHVLASHAARSFHVGSAACGLAAIDSSQLDGPMIQSISDAAVDVADVVALADSCEDSAYVAVIGGDKALRFGFKTGKVIGAGQLSASKLSVKMPKDSKAKFTVADNGDFVISNLDVLGSYSVCIAETNQCGPSVCSTFDVVEAVRVELAFEATSESQFCGAQKKVGLSLHAVPSTAPPGLGQGDGDCDGMADSWFALEDAWTGNPDVDWGKNGSDDDPQFVEFNLGQNDFPAQQFLTWLPTTADVAVGVHYSGGTVTMLLTLKVLSNGGVIAQFSKIPIQPGRLWRVGVVHGSAILGSEPPLFSSCKPVSKCGPNGHPLCMSGCYVPPTNANIEIQTCCP